MENELKIIRPKNPTVKLHLDLTTNTDFDKVTDAIANLCDELGISIDCISFRKLD